MSFDRFRPHSIPEHAHPMMKRLLVEMNRQQCTYQTMNERTGLHQDTIRRWRDKSVPKVDDLEACFNVLGFRLAVVGAGYRGMSNEDASD